MKINFELDGLDKLQATAERTIIVVRREARKIVLAEAEAIMAESQSQVPVETGTLRDSAFIEVDDEGNATFGYGKDGSFNEHSKAEASAYMVKQHEDLSLRHTQGKAKFLEDPVKQHAAMMQDTMAAKIRRALARR